MKRILASLAVLSALHAIPPSADAQPPQSRLKTPTGPTISPYLDLTNRAFTPEYAYFRRIRPDIQQRRHDAQLAAELRDLQLRPPLPQIPTTLETRYRNVGGFYGHSAGYYSQNRSRFNRSLFVPRY